MTLGVICKWNIAIEGVAVTYLYCCCICFFVIDGVFAFLQRTKMRCTVLHKCKQGSLVSPLFGRQDFSLFSWGVGYFYLSVFCALEDTLSFGQRCNN